MAEAKTAQKHELIRAGLAASGGRCVWCERPVVLVADIPPGRLVYRRHDSWFWVYHVADGRIRKSLVATLDHIGKTRGRRRATWHSEANTRVACGPCNSRRE